MVLIQLLSFRSSTVIQYYQCVFWSTEISYCMVIYFIELLSIVISWNINRSVTKNQDRSPWSFRWPPRLPSISTASKASSAWSPRRPTARHRAAHSACATASRSCWEAELGDPSATSSDFATLGTWRKWFCGRATPLSRLLGERWLAIHALKTMALLSWSIGELADWSCYFVFSRPYWIAIIHVVSHYYSSLAILKHYEPWLTIIAIITNIILPL